MAFGSLLNFSTSSAGVIVASATEFLHCYR
jgi:hypothetical protein